MNTANIHRVPMLKANRMRDYVFLPEDLEPAIPARKLEQITNEWNEGAGPGVYRKEAQNAYG